MVPFSIAYLISADSFVPLHVVQGVALAVQAAAMCIALRLLGVRLPLAAVGGLMFALIPAYEAQFSLRTVHIHWTFALTAVAFALFVAQIRSRFRPLTSSIMVLCGLTGFFIYDSPYLLYLVLAPLVFLRRGWTWQNALLVGGAWLLAPVVAAVRLVILRATGTSFYQSTVAESRTVTDPHEIADLFGRVWWGTVDFIRPPYGWLLTEFSVVILIVTIIIVVVFAHSGQTSSPWRTVVIAPAALVLAPFASLVYVQERSHLLDHMRVFSVAALLLVLGIITGADKLTHRSGRAASLVAVAIALPLVPGAAASREFQREQSDAQMRVLGAIENVLASGPGVSGDPVVVVDDSGILRRSYYTLMPDTFPGALNYLSHQPDRSVTVCSREAVPDAPALPHCVVPPNGAIKINGVAQSSTTQIVEIRQGGNQLPVVSSKLPPRARNLLPCIERQSCAAGPEGVSAQLR